MQRKFKNLRIHWRGIQDDLHASGFRIDNDIRELIDLILENQVISWAKMRENFICIYCCDLLVCSAIEKNTIVSCTSFWMIACPVGVFVSVCRSSVCTPAAVKMSERNCPSAPMTPACQTDMPAFARAIDWFSPFPPGYCFKSSEERVSFLHKVRYFIYVINI